MLRLTWELNVPKGAALCCLLTVGQPLCQGPRPTSLHFGLALEKSVAMSSELTGGETGSVQVTVLQAAQLVSGKAKFGIQVP